ncbi:MAG: hypothetical protein ACRDFA_10000 [bacterium]
MISSRVVMLAAVALLLIWTAAAAGTYELVVIAEDGGTLWARPVGEGSPVVLQYTNSLYLAPTQEHFTVKPGGFALREVWSTSDGVLAYNSLPAPYLRRGKFFISSVRAFVPAIVTRIGPIGQQTLHIGSEELPLYKAGTGIRVTIALRRNFPGR